MSEDKLDQNLDELEEDAVDNEDEKNRLYLVKRH